MRPTVPLPSIRSAKPTEARLRAALAERRNWRGALWVREREKIASSGDIAVGGDGNLENPGAKRNRKVFHKSLVLLWIAIVDECR